MPTPPHRPLHELHARCQARYLSFDLARVSQPILQVVAADLQRRKIDPAAQLRTTVRLYPLVAGVQPIDALTQGRFAEDAIVAR